VRNPVIVTDSEGFFIGQARDIACTKGSKNEEDEDRTGRDAASE